MKTEKIGTLQSMMVKPSKNMEDERLSVRFSQNYPAEKIAQDPKYAEFVSKF